jgi:hypothetical protein
MARLSCSHEDSPHSSLAASRWYREPAAADLRRDLRALGLILGRWWATGARAKFQLKAGHAPFQLLTNLLTFSLWSWQSRQLTIDVQIQWEGKVFSAEAFLKGLERIKEEVLKSFM